MPAGEFFSDVLDLVEERLFERRRDLFTDLSLVFLDTTTLYFTGEGGETLGRRGKSKDHRPDLMQMVVAMVMDGDGRPVCTEMWPGNTADVTALLPIIDRLRSRFIIGRVCVIGASGVRGPHSPPRRGMISKATMQGLEDRKLEYILGARERTDPLIREIVLEDKGPFTPLRITKAKGQAALQDGKQPKPNDETQLWVKEVRVGDTRYIVCRNELEANKNAADRAAVLDGLEQQLKQGDKALIGDSAYRRFLKSGGKKTEKVFRIDPGKVADEARFDGIFVLRTNTKISPLQAVLRYRDLLQVETLFRSTKSLLHTRPIFHSSDAAIRGHVFCSFLALVLKKDLADHCATKDFKPEWGQAFHDLDRLEEITVADEGQELVLRTDATGCTPRPVPISRCRPAAQAQKSQTTAQDPSQTAIETPRSSKTWCHVRLNFSILCLESESYRFKVFKTGQGDERDRALSDRYLQPSKQVRNHRGTMPPKPRSGWEKYCHQAIAGE